MAPHLWYYGRADRQLGPVDEPTLRTKIASGEVTPDFLVWREGMADWMPLGQVAELHEPGVIPLQAPSAPPGAYPMSMGAPTSGLAIASLVCGILSLFFCYLWIIPAIPAVICGHMALSRIRQGPYAMGGRGMAIAGLVTGYLGILITLVTIAVVIFAIVAESGGL